MFYADVVCAIIALEPLMQLDTPAALIGRVTGTAQMHRTAGELLPLAVAPALAARFGVQAVLIGGGVILALVALSSLGEARAIDRVSERSLRGRRAVRPYMPTSDEPISPNP